MCMYEVYEIGMVGYEKRRRVIITLSRPKKTRTRCKRINKSIASERPAF